MRAGQAVSKLLDDGISTHGRPQNVTTTSGRSVGRSVLTASESSGWVNHPPDYKSPVIGDEILMGVMNCMPGLALDAYKCTLLDAALPLVAYITGT